MSSSTVAPDRLARLRAACLALPEATEKVAWGADPTWRIRDKIFAMQKGNYEGGRPSLWLKAEDGAQAMLVESKPELFFVPPYVGMKGWIGVHLDARTLPWPMIVDLIRESYRLIAPKSNAKTSSKKKSASRKQAQKRAPVGRAKKPKKRRDDR